MEIIRIGEISNYYGGLYVTEVDGRYLWTIENYDTDFGNMEDWEECDEQLFTALIDYEKRRKK